MPRLGFRRFVNRKTRRNRRPDRIVSSAMTHFQEDARMEPQVMENTGIRHDLVARIRAEIRAGTYDTPAKLEIAFQQMLYRSGKD